MGNTGQNSNNNIKVIWFDEMINNEENKNHFQQFKSFFNNIKGYQSLDEGFENFYENKQEKNFQLVFVIVSGKLFGRYIKKIKYNINKIINIPYTYIFTSFKYKKVLLNQIQDKEHVLSYDTMIKVNDVFYNPGGVYDNFDYLFKDIKIKIGNIESSINVKPRINDKLNYEGVLTFEYLEGEEDLLAPALYKDIITNEKINLEHCKNFHEYILSFNEGELNNLVKNLDLFKYIPFEILSKYWARLYTIESDFYKVLNNHLMKSKLPFNYKTFIKMLYTGVEINSLKSYSGKYLFRGSVINKLEIEKIKKYKISGKLSNIVVFSKAFLSFSEDKNQAIKFCGTSNDSKIGILYILENNNINLHESNANVQNFSVFPNEKEILFFPGSSFIIKNIKDMNDNKIEITLNYNGKFKEKYSIIYENQEKINDLIYNNIFTKNIAGEKLTFIKNGKYLIKEEIGNGGFARIFKGKDLETDEIIAIKQIKKSKSYNQDQDFLDEVNSLKTISEKTKYSCNYKDHFETKDYYYIIYDFYDDNLDHFFDNYRKRFSNNLPPNLISKIFNQLNIAFKVLSVEHIFHRDIKPSNILIKFSNEEKTDFDSIIAGYDISKKNTSLDMIGTILFMPPEVLKNNGNNNNSDLFSIGVTIYYLYFGKFPYDTEDMLSIMKGPKLNFQIEEDRQLEDLIKKLLKENPDERLNWDEYFIHPFFNQYEY